MNGTQFSEMLQDAIKGTLKDLPPNSNLSLVADGGEVVDYPAMLKLPRMVVALMKATGSRPESLIEEILREGAKKRSDDQRPSMAQDMFKGRRTETDFINGYVAGSSILFQYLGSGWGSKPNTNVFIGVRVF